MLYLFQSIKMRIALGYGAILIATLIAAIILTSNNQSAQSQLDGFVVKTLPDLKKLNALQADTKQLVLNGYSLYGTTMSSDEFAQQRQTLGQQMDEARQGIQSTTGRRDIENSLKQLDQDLTGLANVMGTGNVDWDRAREELSQLNATANGLMADLEQLRTRVSDNAAANVDEITAQLDTSLWIIYLLVLVLVGVAIGGFVLAQKQIAQPIGTLAKRLNGIASKRDLTQQLEAHNTREIDSMSESINGLITMFREGMGSVNQAISGMSDSVNDLGNTTVDSASAVNQLQTDIDKLMQVMHALEQQMEECVQRSESAASEANQSAEQMGEGQRQVQATAESIGGLADDIDNTSDMLQTLQNAGDQVSGVVKTIAEIADQTNLLALNAAIEAARAGESGRGFAVVADEVRTLAVRTHQSTVEINDMLEKIVESIQSAVSTMDSNKDKVQESVTLAQELVTTLEQGRNSILSLVDVSQTASRLANDSKAQASDVRQQVNDFEQLGGRVSDSNDRVQQASANLSKLAQGLTDTVSRFKL